MHAVNINHNLKVFINQIIIEGLRGRWVNSQNYTEASVVPYIIIQSPQWFSELTHSSSEASNSNTAIYWCLSNCYNIKWSSVRQSGLIELH